MKPIKLYWCRGEGRHNVNRRNFGDYLSADLVEIFSGRKVSYSSVAQADMMAVGSILGREKKARHWAIPRKLHIWGSGAGGQDMDMKFSDRHYYHAVRGLRTRQQIKGHAQHPVVGDPGLLSPWVIEGRRQSPGLKIRVGVIPHHTQQQHPAFAALLSAIPGARIIDACAPVRQVLEEIAACDFVISSSLHGLIVADSFGVPNQWLALERCVIQEYKYRDYYSSFGIVDCEPLLPAEFLHTDTFRMDQWIEAYRRPGLAALQEGLIGAFPRF